MFEIRGKVNTAVCYATVVEDEAVEQIRRMCDHEFTRDSRIRIMPDVHAGKGCTVGTTMTIRDKVVPNIVGVDIGCGMYTVSLGRVPLNLARLDDVAHYIPSGLNVWDRPREPFDLSELRCSSNLKGMGRLECSLGTLGGGNHFIEVDEAADGTRYLVIHSGSRNLGKQVATYYQRLAIDMNRGKEEYLASRDALIAEYRATGRSKEIQAALKALHSRYRKGTMPEDLCYLYGTRLEDYLHDVEVCQRFARLNREKMATIILEETGLEALDAFHTIHNYIDTEERILRKGAIAAHEGEKVLIPINMRDGSVLGVGKGNPDWNYSAPHGAGRVLSRRAAKEKLDLEEYRREMAGVYTTSVSEATLDEAPMAYKSLSDIMEPIGESVHVLEVLKPIYNFKAN